MAWKLAENLALDFEYLLQEAGGQFEGRAGLGLLRGGGIEGVYIELHGSLSVRVSRFCLVPWASISVIPGRKRER